MSGINSAMNAGVSGLAANSAALASISDDIANVNTVGYKANDVQFSDLVTSSSGAGYASGGVQTVSTSNVTQQGVMQTASSPTDMGISGNGFFVTSQSAASPSTTNPALYTRAGAFTANSQGYLVNSAGLYLEGWPADANGNVTTDPSNQALLQPINVSQISTTPVPTTSVAITANLNSSQAVSQAATDFGTAAADAYNPTSAIPAPPAAQTATSMAAYTSSGGTTGTKPDFTMQIPISNSLGGAQTVQVDFLKSAVPDQYYAEVVAVPASSVTTAAGVPAGQIATGVVAFTSSGQLDTANTTLPLSLTFGASTAAAPTAPAVNWASSLGIGGQTVALSLTGGSGGLTQENVASSVTSVNPNGTPTGSLSSVEVGTNGDVTAVFSNGTTRLIAQVAIATFANPDGLTSVSGDAYQASLQSGTYNLHTAGSGGAGTIDPSNLESSTVDLSTEFTNMITTQRAYSASSKIITTADSMLQDLISIIR